jgi:Rieske Fe-S protein
VDIALTDDAREGLTGTTPANVYKSLPDADQITIAPDWRPPEEQPAWRRDFPIDWPTDAYVARRDFTKFMILTSLAFAVGQVWIGVQNAWRRRRGQPEVKKIASLGALPVGGSVVFHYPEATDHCILIRTGPNTLLAYSQKCTHLSCAVVPRLDQGTLYCPCHEGVFDLASGREIAGPPPRPLPRIGLKVNGDDVYATGVEVRTV